MSLKNLHIILLLFCFTVGFSQEKPVLKTSIDTTTIRIGEQFHLSFTVSPLGKVHFPELKDKLGKIEVLDSVPVDTLNQTLIKRFLLTSFDSGRWVIPQQEILINNQKYLTDSIIINVGTVKVDTLKQPLFPIKTIKDEPFALIDARPYLWWIIGVMALLALALYLLLRKKGIRIIKKRIVPPFIIAMDRLKALDQKQLIKSQQLKVFYIELTDIIRRYIEEDLSIPALESTSDELLSTISDFNESSHLEIDKQTIEKLNDLLKSADLVKFAKYKPNLNQAEADRLVAEFILNGLKPKEKKEVANG
ncbi:MAG: hypothetical protein COS42_12715 [Flavobacteriales bacterium CG03_land_8_20_14_0_80_35_15]|nr:hypothetical protein [Zetaproteobacteria bacterium]OIO12274.1 MAG: hypothetical protein AUJ53_02665 [Flavobacteriaceae bacterium CG1_02_35_72]PIV15915.1 MAG: hypothetical protein COS42_12715 [Flavobacteriales bacterium CG03_land_8_20_14_0_80_35_15]PIX06865.1 MAG: hypothetical protein COZ76_06565 [Flavobacteriales bacterium CG_4_8_14_3_um_filter_35_10]PJA05031.1 MAG: hypothetical protein COX71_08765 [Flavobacteriales bacterium CG_4_10_14_0_2_um_filter_35_18]